MMRRVLASLLVLAAPLLAPSLLLLGGSASAQTAVEASKLNGLAVIENDGVNASKLNVLVVIDAGTVAASKLNILVILGPRTGTSILFTPVPF